MNYTAAVRFLSSKLQNDGFNESYKSKTSSRYFEKITVIDGQSVRLKVRISDHELDACFNHETGEITDSHRQPDGVVLDRDADYTKAELQVIFEEAYGKDFVNFNATKVESLASLRRRAVQLARETAYVASAETGEMWYMVSGFYTEKLSKSKDRDYLLQEIDRLETLGVKK